METLLPIAEVLDNSLEIYDCPECDKLRYDDTAIEFPELKRSAKRGCVMCQMIVQAGCWSRDRVIRSTEERGSPASESSLPYINVSWDETHFTIYHWDDEPEAPVATHIEFISNSAAEPPPPFIRFAAPISQPGSDSSVKKIREWISLCSLHPACCTLNEPTLPTRVIDVTTASPDVVLVETNGKRGIYICLSHPWGEEQPLVTTTKTIEDHKIIIPHAELPLTFKDAIEMTRHLGIKWLWIDALCIIQDSRDDWEIESASMANIYGNSHLTLSASSSKCGSDGCFSKVQVPEHIEIPNGTGNQSLGGVYFRQIPTNMRQCKELRNPASYKVYMMPLMERSWVLQERLLSPRFLHFGSCEMIWECKSGIMCECNGEPVDISGLQGIKTFYNNALTDNISPHYSSKGTWRELSKVFFGCKITYPEDRLPALSGLSRAFQRSNPDVGSYMAGLWSKDLPNALLWWCECSVDSFFNTELKLSDPIELYPVTRHNGAPTWSWASLCGETGHFKLIFALDESRDLRNTVPSCTVISTQYRAKGLDGFGATAAGNLTLESPVASAQLGIKEIKVSFFSKKEWLFPSKDAPFQFEQGKTELDAAEKRRYIDVIAANAGVIRFRKGSGKGCDNEQPCHVWFTLDCWMTDSRASPGRENGPGDADDISCATLAKGEVECCKVDGNFHPRVLGLLLRASKLHPGCYERIGLFCADEDFFPNAETRVFTIV